MLCQNFVIFKDDQIVPHKQACWVGEESKDMGEEMLAESPDYSLFNRKEF